MDEPFVSLDHDMAEEMLALTEALIAETRPATILVTHSEAEAEAAGRAGSCGLPGVRRRLHRCVQPLPELSRRPPQLGAA